MDHIPLTPKLGNYSDTFTDLSVQSTGESISFSRTYNSMDSRTGLLGRGWTFGYAGSVRDETYSFTDASGNVQTAVAPGLKVVSLSDEGNLLFRLENGAYTAFNSYDSLTQDTDGTFTLKTPEQESYRFDAAGYLVSITDRSGNKTAITVNDTAGHPTEITDSVGRQYELDYNADGTLASVTDPMGRVVQYAYAGGNLTAVTDPMGFVTTYTYDGTTNLLTKITDPLGHTQETVAYNGDGTLASVTDAQQTVSSYAYDPDANTVTVTANDKSTIYTYDAANLLSQTQDPDGKTTAYNQYGQVTSEPDGSGTKSYQYDANGNETQVSYDNGSSETYTYNSDNTVASYADQNGKKTFYLYDSAGNLTTKAVQKDGTTADYQAGTNDSQFDVTTYTSNSDGTPATQTDPDGTVTTYGPYQNGNPTLVKTEKDGKETRVDSTYNADGWLLSKTTTADGKTTSVTTVYDLDGRTVRTTDQDGKTTRTVLDADGNTVQKIGPDQYQASEDGLNDTPSSYAYYDKTVGDRYVYNAFGDTVRYTSAQNKTTRYVYNNTLHKIVQQIYPDQYDASKDNLKDADSDGQIDAGSSDSYSDSTVGDRSVYDASGNLVRTTSAQNKTTRYVYNGSGKLIQQINPEQYDASKDELTDADRDGILDTGTTNAYSDNTVGDRFVYDSNGNLLRETAADGRTTRYVYGGSENLRQQINANQYDPSKDSLKDENHDGIADDTAGDAYSDDGVGYRYAYYDDGTKQTETTPDGSVFQYNQDGNVTSEQYAGGATDATAYNEDGTVGSVSNANGYNLTYQYNDSGNVSEMRTATLKPSANRLICRKPTITMTTASLSATTA